MAWPSSAAAKRRISKRTHARTVSKAPRKAKGKKSRPSRRRSYQQAPTADRYKEIQQALAKKGYYKGEANGEWGPDSTEALKRFQVDQNLTPDGKLGSLSLIALGLGPKRMTAQSSTPPAPTPGVQK